MFRKLTLFFVLVCSGILYAQEETATTSISQKGVTELRQELSTLAENSKFVEAIPVATELITRLAELDTPDAKTLLPHLHLYRAYGYIQEYQNNKNDVNKLILANAELNKIINEFPNSEVVIKAITLRYETLLAQKNYKEAVAELSKLLEPPFIDKISKAVQLDTVRKIAHVLYATQSWSDGEKWFRLLLATSNTPEDKVLSASALMQMAMAKKNYNEVLKYFPYMSINEPARYDIRLSVALLNAGNELAKSKKFAEAAMFYSIVYNKEDILKFYEEYKDKMAKEYERISASSQDSNKLDAIQRKINMAEDQIKALSDMRSYTAELMALKSVNYLETKRDYESYWAYMRLIDSFPESPNVEDFYYAAIIGANNIGKTESLFTLASSYAKEFPEGKYIKEISLQKAQYFYNNKMTDELLALSFDFIEKYNDDLMSGDIIYLMASTWISSKDYGKIITNLGSFLSKYPDSPMIDALLYWLGMAYLAEGKFADAYDNFEKLTDAVVNSFYIEDATFRKGVAAYGKQDLPKAIEIFEEFKDLYTESPFLGEVEFFLGDINLASGMAKESVDHYLSVENYPSSSQHFIDNAYLQIVKIMTNEERYEEVLDIISKYLDKYPMGNVAMMNFEKAKVLEKVSKPADGLFLLLSIIQENGTDKNDEGVDKALQRYAEHYNPVKDTLEASKVFLTKMLSDEAFFNDMATVPAKRYRYFLENPKIDSAIYRKLKSDKNFGNKLLTNKTPIEELLKNIEEQLAKVPAEAPAQTFQNLLAKSSDNPTMMYRLMMALDLYTKTPAPARSFNIDDFKVSSPATLIWIGRQNEKYGPELAREVYDYLIEEYSESEYIVEALIALAELEDSQGNLEKSLELYVRIQDEYGTHDGVAKVAIKEAETLQRLKKIKESKEKYESIIRNVTWRGDIHAEALYKLGLIYLDENELDKAMMYFDRVSLGFANCPEWTGKSTIESVKILRNRGKIDEAKELAREFLRYPDSKNSPDFKLVENFYNSL